MSRIFFLSCLALIFTFALALPAAGQSCTCYYGSDYHGNPIDPAETYCGYQVCGADDQYYECTSGGWQAIGGGPCGTPPDRCACSGGTSYDGTVVSSDATFCGMQVCGLDENLYECRPSGWHGIGGGPCGQGEAGKGCEYDAGACSCSGGFYYDPVDPQGIPIPTTSTYCGMTVCGDDNQYYQCTGGGWQALGQGPCYPNGTADYDSDGLTDGLEHILMQRFAPRVRLHLNDPQRPSSVEWYLDRVHMRFHHGASCPDHQILNKGSVTAASLVTQTHQSSGYGAPICSHDSALESSSGISESSFFLQIPNDSEESLTRHGSTPEDWTCYAHVFPAATWNNVPAGQLDVQYWFFYPYNGEFDGTAGSAHEGDWEHMTVRLDASTLEPLAVYLAAHEGGEWHDWSDLRCTDQGHPVVYSAVDSHASFIANGMHPYDFFRTDYTTLLGPIWDCQDRMVNLGEQSVPLPGAGWNTYNGRWGEVGEEWRSGSSGPFGPAVKDKWFGVEE
ncbi:MAG: Vps62-related protein [Acidobacteriota bacterium]|nr:Vps62-related protein [Acidobacteriota bacterium]